MLSATRKPMTRIWQHDDPPLTEKTIAKWVTPKAVYNELKPEDQELVNNIKLYLNNTETALSWHDGIQDKKCKFHGLHMHLMTKTSYKIHATYPYKRLMRNIQATSLELKSEEIKFTPQFGNYMTLPPKEFLGCNTEDIIQYIPATPTVRQRLTKKPTLYQQIDALLNLMDKYQLDTKDDLFRATYNSTEDRETMVTLTRDRNWPRIYTTAKEVWSITNQIENQTYYEWFMNYTPQEHQPDLMRELQTKEYFTKWTREQNINPDDILRDMHAVLKMTNSKENTLYLQGASNAGKTFILKGIVPVDSKAGYHTTSKDFPFGEAVNQPIILINECTLESPAKAEVYKNIFGGEPTQVNIKNRSSQLMPRKPVLLTTNDPVWKEVAAQKQPLLNRLYAYMNLATSNVTKIYSKLGKPNCKFFQRVFNSLDKRTPADDLFVLF